MDRVSIPSAELEAKTQEWAKNTWVWVLHDNEAVACTVTNKDGDNWTVRLPNGSEVKMNKSECDLQNPPKFDKCEDMANLTHLNELSVLANLKDRYLSNLIYTYSGLFLVVINPWRRLPLYTDEIVAMYKGRKRKEMPPHIFAVCDEAYRAMLENKENQSLLITGESGAGKTENTKKVIQYLASIAGTAGALSSASGESGQGVLEKQIVKTNPLLESFGNAKTVRNNNSSRFGKFIRIEFRGDGKIVGCNIDNYLLEKSRVVRHSQNERSFHIFYQIIAGATDEMKKSYLLENFRHYKYLQGITEIDGVNNAAEFKDTIEAMDIIGFSDQDKSNIWSIVSACMLFGNMAFSSGKRDDAASITDPSVADKVAYLLGIPSADFQKGLIKPRVKAGREWVTAMVTAEKAAASVDALAKSTYERLFKWIVKRINQALETQSDAQTFIGCLDIAGFEIFELNSFEQLCINLTNEKLQMFFNHHMFILEQEEYAKEGIEWKFIDFGFDLIPTIDLIEKPMGIMSILDEECLFPKATDKSFLEKLNATHDKKHPKYSTVRLHPDTFVLKHYAGEVEYDTKDWLEKNKDPINDNVAKSLSRSSNALVAVLFEEFVDMEGEGDAAKPSHAKRQKANTFITVSQRHRQNLNHLMTTLQNTVPHFVRCIIPNEQKKPGLIEAPLVMDQLKCNGVLEGIRICRLGFPSKVPFAEFKQRYEILATDVIPKGFMDGKVACEKLVKALEIPAEQVRIGISKVFFKAGVIAELEERRDAKLGRLITGFQAICRGWFARRQFRREHGQEEAIRTIQRNARVFIELYQWSWWKLYRQVKPLLSIHRQEQQEKGLKDKIKELEKALEEETKKRTELEALKTQIITERDRLLDDLQAERDTLEETIASLKRTEEARKELQALADDLEGQLEEADKNASELEKSKRQLQLQVEELKAQLSDDSDKLAAIEETKKMMEGEMEVLKRQFASEKANLVSELDTERTKMEGQISSLKEQLTSAQASLDRLKRQKDTLSAEKDELVASLEESDRAKNKAENALRKLEADYQEVQTELRDKSSKLSILEEQKRTTEARLNEFKAKLEESEAARATIEVIKRNLEAELEDISTQLEEATKGRAAAERRNKTLEDELAEVSLKLEEEKRKREDSEAARQGLQNELEAFKENLTKMQIESDNALMEALKGERAKNKALEDGMAAEAGRRAAAEERLVSESAKIKELERRIREIREVLRQ